MLPFSSPKAGNPLDPFPSLSMAPAQELWPSIGICTFAIGPTAVDEMPKADCRTCKGNNAPGPFSGPCCCSLISEPKLKLRWDVHLSGDDDQLG